MKAEDTAELGIIIGMLAEAYRQSITQVTIQAYQLALREFSIEEIKAAAVHLLKTSRFMPVPCEICAFITSGGMDQRARVEAVWQVLIRALHKYGYDYTILFDDMALTATVRAMGGMERLCKIPNEEFYKWTRREFENIYCIFLDNPPGSDRWRPLVGWLDRTNAANGYQEYVKGPMLIETGLPVLPNQPSPQQLLTNSRRNDLPRVEIKKPPTA